MSLHVTVHFITPWVETESTPPEIQGLSGVDACHFSTSFALVLFPVMKCFMTVYYYIK